MIAFVVFAQRIGLTLEEIGAELAKLPPHQALTRRDCPKRLSLGLTEWIGGVPWPARQRRSTRRPLACVVR